MKKLKYLVCLLLTGALFLPYTAFAEYNKAEYGYGEGVIRDLFAAKSENTFTLAEDYAPITENESDCLRYIASKIPEFNAYIEIPEEYRMPEARFNQIYIKYMGSYLQLEHPEIFYITNSFGYNYLNNDEHTVTSINLSFKSEYAAGSNNVPDTAKIRAAQALIDEEIDNITAGTEGMTDLEKVLYVHDYIVSHYRYDTTYQSRTLDTMIEQKQGVCQGYTYLFFTAMKRLGIPCVNVPNIFNAEVESGHIWNKVQIDGEWYNIDLTYDDPISDFSNSCNHYYFLLNDNEIRTRDDDTHQEKNEHYRMETKKWDGIHDIEPSTADTTKYSGFMRIAGPTSYKDGNFWCLSLNQYDDHTKGGTISFNDICTVVFDGNIVLRERYTKARDYTWYVWDSDKWYVNDLFSSLVMNNGKLYFNSPNTVYEFDTASNELVELYKYSGESNICNTYFYGLSVSGDKLYADYGELHLDGSYVNGRHIEVPVSSENPEPTPEPTPEVFPEFEEPFPVDKPIVEYEEVTAIDEETHEEVTSYEVTIAVEVSEAVKEIVEAAEKTITVSVAKYSESGSFIGFETVELDENNEAKVIADKTCDMIKTFIWAGFIMPLSEANEVQFAQQASETTE